MAEIPRGPTTKEKLATIVSGFDEFDTEMKRGTRVRFVCPARHNQRLNGPLTTLRFMYSNEGRKMNLESRS